MVNFDTLKENLCGSFCDDIIHKTIYSTDASAYKEMPLAVIYPKNSDDLKLIIQFASDNKLTIIPRTAGTSLAGQVVGNGIVVDVSRYFNKIIELNTTEKWVKVEPGVVLDELNKYLQPFDLFFGPETSTSNRCMIGGMVGNNSCGARSLVYGSTRDHTLEMKVILSDGSDVHFKPLTKTEFKEKSELKNFEGKLYNHIYNILSNPVNQKNIANEYPDKAIKRRNTGYAIDLLCDTEIFTESTEKFNFCKLLAGSEGTLAFTTEIKLNLVKVPAKEQAILCIHMATLNDALKANLIALKYKPTSVELIDKTILELTKENIEQKRNRFFIRENPEAILIVEFVSDSLKEIQDKVSEIEKEMRSNGYGFHFPLITGSDISKVWNLRKAGLGLLSNMPGDSKPVAVVEDTAVNPAVLPEYIDEFKQILKKYNLNFVVFAHVGSGELHLRPILNLKDEKDRELFHTIAFEVSRLVKKYKGSLSGEHGDGRLRGEFIPYMIGENNYQIIKEIKSVWDKNGVFNFGKITDTPKMNTNLRYEANQPTKDLKTYFDFGKEKGILRAIEKCNGSGDCRKTEIIGGVMCPSFMATKDETTTTRARANILREFITDSKQENSFNHSEIYNILDLCISCKGCKSECPSSVDMAKLKAEFLQHWYESNKIPLRSKIVANLPDLNSFLVKFHSISNFFLKNKFFSNIITSFIGFSNKRKLPLLHKFSLNYYVKNLTQNSDLKQEVYLFIDEFTNYNDTQVGIKAIKFLNRLGYRVLTVNHLVSGRTYISKGFLKKAKKIANENVTIFRTLISSSKPLIGIEPSAILTFRDEYPELVDKHLVEDSIKLSSNVFLIDEFIANEFDKGFISKDLFTKDSKNIKFHGHCQQKSIATTTSTKKILSIPANFTVSEIKSGCCGMAGSFGYEKEHYDLSMKIGNLVLFPEINISDTNTVIVASGTSCRHHISDGTSRKAIHPVELLYASLKIK
ncbi:MAG: FAD-binding protein [Bacteroidetes bacterium GWA2_30_7]|nr:MAG: FAD-binding protein [Bacteroidetes bacterium GWA2_30_7]